MNAAKPNLWDNTAVCIVLFAVGSLVMLGLITIVTHFMNP